MLRSLSAVATCLLLGAVAAPAQDRAPPAGEALAQAEAAGHLERVVGPRSFRDELGNLVVVTCALDTSGATPLLTCKFEHLAVGAMRAETLETEVAVDLDGRTRRAGFTLVRGRQRTTARGVVEAGTLRLDVQNGEADGGVAERREVPWSDDALPFSLATFVLPALAEHLPDELTFRLFEPVSGALAPGPSTLVVGAPGADGAREVRIEHAGGSPDLVRVDAEGRLLEVVLRGHARLSPIAAEEAAALRRAAAGGGGASGDPSGERR